MNAADDAIALMGSAIGFSLLFAFLGSYNSPGLVSAHSPWIMRLKYALSVPRIARLSKSRLSIPNMSSNLGSMGLRRKSLRLVPMWVTCG